jgi:hypothetical protein
MATKFEERLGGDWLLGGLGLWVAVSDVLSDLSGLEGFFGAGAACFLKVLVVRIRRLGADNGQRVFRD